LRKGSAMLAGTLVIADGAFCMADGRLCMVPDTHFILDGRPA